MLRPLLLALALAAGAAPAQTFDEAVRANVMLAFELCFADQPSPEARVAAFRGAGFTHTRETEQTAPGFFDIHDRFAAPAETARVMFYHGQTAPSCTVFSDHVGAFDAAKMVDQWINQRFPGRFVDQPPGTVVHGRTTECPRFTEAASGGLPFEILFVPTVGGGSCADNRTVSTTPGRFP